MTIKSVGGTNVYVISAQPVEHAKTSTGQSWANMVSSLRWRNWQEVQENILREIQLESADYKTQLRVYRQQQADLQRALRETNNDIAALTRGEMSSLDQASRTHARDLNRSNLNAQRARLQEALQARSLEASAQRAEQRTASNIVSSLDTNTQRTFRQGEGVLANQRTDNVTGNVTRSLRRGIQDRGDISSDDVDAMKAARVQAEITAVAERTGDEATATAQVLDAYNSSPEGSTYAQAWQSTLTPSSSSDGAPAPRIPRISTSTPAVTAPQVASRANERQRLLDERQRLLDELASLRAPEAPQRDTDILRRTQRRFAEVDQPTAARDINVFERAQSIMKPFIDARTRGMSLVNNTPEEIEDARALGVQDAIMFAANRQPTGALQASVDAPSTPTPPNALDAERRALSVRMDRAGIDLDETAPPERGSVRDPRQLNLDMFQHSPEPPAEGEGILTSSPPPTPHTPDIFGETGRTTEQFIDEEVPELMFEAFKDSDAFRTSDFSTPPTNTDTKAARRAKYQSDFITEGQKLSSQKKRFNRLSKPELSRADRVAKVSPYIIVVDDLYDTSNDNNINNVTAEINKLYKDDPITRRAAHEYLIAKDIIEQDTLHPEE